MAACCRETHRASPQTLNSLGWRRTLWAALGVNALMFLVEIAAGLASGSASLQADALDFLGDSINYAVSLGVAGMALMWRARVALLKGGCMLAFGLWVLGIAVWHAVSGTVPEAQVMGVIGVLALTVNVGVALLLYRFRAGDANMRSVWICSRNDAIGNLAVMGAALGVFGTGMGWPDLIVATVMAAMAMTGGWQIIRHARSELATPGLVASATAD